MKVVLVASTQFHGASAFSSDWHYGEGVADADLLAEASGRLCYMSWHKPNPATATNAGYVANIIDHKHFSVLEHGSATFLVEGVSRSLTHELIRHRQLSFSELSQRYVDVEDARFIVPPGFAKDDEDEAVARVYLADAAQEARSAYRFIVRQLESKGLKRKQAREAARAVMPNCTETKIVVTGNMRAWREVIQKRYHVAADAEIRELAGEILRQLKLIAPSTFQDFPEVPFS